MEIYLNPENLRKHSKDWKRRSVIWDILERTSFLDSATFIDPATKDVVDIFQYVERKVDNDFLQQLKQDPQKTNAELSSQPIHTLLLEGNSFSEIDKDTLLQLSPSALKQVKTLIFNNTRQSLSAKDIKNLWETLNLSNVTTIKTNDAHHEDIHHKDSWRNITLLFQGYPKLKEIYLPLYNEKWKFPAVIKKPKKGRVGWEYANTFSEN